MKSCVWTLEIAGKQLAIIRADGIFSQAVRYAFAQFNVKFELIEEYPIKEILEGDSYWSFALHGDLEQLKLANEYLTGMVADIRRHINVSIEAAINSETKAVIPLEYL